MVNREEHKEQRRKYYEEHKEQLKEYGRKYSRKYREEHKEQRNEYDRKYREEIRDTLFNVLGGKKCVECGNNDGRVLQIHHKNNDGKKDRKQTKNIYNYYLDNLDEFQQKLEILCCNCHQIKTLENNKFNGESLNLNKISSLNSPV